MLGHSTFFLGVVMLIVFSVNGHHHSNGGEGAQDTLQWPVANDHDHRPKNQDEEPQEDIRASHPRFHPEKRHRGSDYSHPHMIGRMPPEVDHRQGNILDHAMRLTGPTEGEFPIKEKSRIERLEEIKSEEETDDQFNSEAEDKVDSYEGYEGYEGVGVYKFHAEGANGFDAANQVCTLEGGNLAIANSKEEADVFVTLWMRHGAVEESDAYVGIHSRNRLRDFRSLLGNTLASTGYVAWRAGEPDNKNGVEHCVSFYRYGGYRDIPCDGPLPFICELRWRNEH
ncbi:pulmonary surfactant-associated protein D-like [Hetaerina americana]|uniref:pulmonary surfactant-associated protein D-like n=1 Tax=Hetaerina americana TaxID=62018 RepID=UPI003A7F4FEE